MSDETEFYRALENTKYYIKNHFELEVFHPTLPGETLRIDNISQKREIVYIFEGKKGNLERAKHQLKQNYLAIKSDRVRLIKEGLLLPYSQIKLFYYSFKRGLLIEYEANLREVNQYRFNKKDIGDLTEKLRKI